MAKVETQSLEDFLEKDEIEKVIQFAEDKRMFYAVKKVLLKTVYDNGVLKKGKDHNPLRNAALAPLFMAQNLGQTISDEELGRELRALAEGVRTVATGFDKIAELSPEKVELPEKINEAR